MTEDIHVHVIDFHNSVPAAVTQNDDGSYSVFLNARLTAEMNKRSYKHEELHIQNKDFDSDVVVDRVERISHEIG